MKLHKILLPCLLVAVIALVGVFALPTEAQAAMEGYYTYNVSNGEAAITGCDTAISGDITIPATLGGYPVTSIAAWAFGDCNSLMSVTIPDSVTSLGYCAFYSCDNLTSVTIPDSVTSIGDSALSFCINLTDITIPDSVTSIGNDAFTGCSSLASITIPDSVTSFGDSAFYRCTSLTSVTITDGLACIGKEAFSGCTSLTSITIPDSVISISNRAFYGCSSLTGIIIPDSMTSIGDYVFSRCTSLTNITIPDSVSNIGEGALSYCTSLASITIPDSVTSIGDSAFHGCDRLINITIPNGVTSIGDSAFHGCDRLINITIPNGVTSIGNAAFNGCSSLTGVTIPEGVTSVGEYAFYGCSSLIGVTIPEGVTSIGEYAFYDCSNLCHVAYAGTEEQRNMIAIGTGNDELTMQMWHNQCSTNPIFELTSCTFDSWHCTLCQTVVAVNKLSNGAHSFADGVCTDCGVEECLEYRYNEYHKGFWITGYTGTSEKVAFPETIENIPVKYLEYPLMNNTYVTEVVIPASIEGIAEEAGSFAGCSNLKKFTVAQENEFFSSDDTGVLYNKDKTRLYAVPNQLAGSYTVASSTKEIAYISFANCKQLTEITIGENVTDLAYCAFMNCDSLTTVEIPKSVISIDKSAFYGCSNLMAYEVAEDNTSYSSDQAGVLFNKDKTWLIAAPQQISGYYTVPETVTGIGSSAFYDCKKLTGITISKNVIEIGSSTFCNCSRLVSITLPDSVTDIYYQAFDGCDNLRDVYYFGTEEQWKAIQISECNDPLLNAKIYYNFTGAIPGDFDGDLEMNDADALYLLRYTLFPERYPITADADVDRDGAVTDADALYLLRHTLFADRYPLYPGKEEI